MRGEVDEACLRAEEGRGESNVFGSVRVQARSDLREETRVGGEEGGRGGAGRSHEEGERGQGSHGGVGEGRGLALCEHYTRISSTNTLPRSNPASQLEAADPRGTRGYKVDIFYTPLHGSKLFR